MACESNDDLVDAAVCLLANGIELRIARHSVYQTPRGYEVQPQYGPPICFSSPTEAARYLITGLQFGWPPNRVPAILGAGSERELAAAPAG